MLNLINVLDAAGAGNEAINDAAALCTDLQPVLRLVGIVVFGIKVVVPIILIVVGMIDMAKAVTEKDENKIKDAQHKLIKKAIAAVLVFLIVTIVGVLMRLIGADDYSKCMTCINNPFSCDIGIDEN